MSLVSVQVEFPQYAHSFSVNVPLNGSILDIKEEISRSLPGKPRVEGQRLIAQGRVLNDSEVVDQLWKSADASRIVHLAVNPISWTNPPEITKPTTTPSLPSSAAASVQEYPSSSSSSSPTSVVHPSTQTRIVLSRHPDLHYLRIQHQNALRVLQNKPISPVSSRSFLRNQSATVVAIAGLTWPRVLDEEYPPELEGTPRATYKHVNIDGRDFLRLESPTHVATPRQRHALKVLTHTFPLMSAPAPVFAHHHVSAIDVRQPIQDQQPAFIPGQPFLFGNNVLGFNARVLNMDPANANANFAGVGGAPVPARPVVQIREVPVRALLTPLIFLCLRTLLLFYFISPARKPLIGIMLGAWVLYEAWGAVRGAIIDLNEMARNADPQPRPNIPDNLPGQNAAPVAGQGAIPVPTPTQPGNAGASNSDIILSRLSALNLDSEAAALDVREGERAPEEQGVFQKARLFVSLIVLTLHPAVWNRRRTALREREGRVRTEARGRLSEANEGERLDERAVQVRERLTQAHARRPRWVREYIDRVMVDDWVDD